MGEGIFCEFSLFKKRICVLSHPPVHVHTEQYKKRSDLLAGPGLWALSTCGHQPPEEVEKLNESYQQSTIPSTEHF